MKIAFILLSCAITLTTVVRIFLISINPHRDGKLFDIFCYLPVLFMSFLIFYIVFKAKEEPIFFQEKAEAPLLFSGFLLSVYYIFCDLRKEHQDRRRGDGGGRREA